MPPKTAVRRTRADRCPGVLRPWIAQDGALVRLRTVGGVLSSASLAALVQASSTYADGDVHLTARANLQVRGLAHDAGRVTEGFRAAMEAAGLLPSRSHELVRNIMVSPLTGRSGGRADLRPLARELDRLLCADETLARLPGRFLFVLDDGRGDLTSRGLDLGVVAVSREQAQVRFGSTQWGPTVPFGEAASTLLATAHRFLDVRGSGEAAPWHVDELPDAGAALAQQPRDPRTRATCTTPAYGPLPQDDGRYAVHVEVPGGVLTPSLAEDLLSTGAREVIVTPWRSVLLPDREHR